MQQRNVMLCNDVNVLFKIRNYGDKNVKRTASEAGGRPVHRTTVMNRLTFRLINDTRHVLRLSSYQLTAWIRAWIPRGKRVILKWNIGHVIGRDSCFHS